MIQLQFMAQVNSGKCTGCNVCDQALTKCERICPAGAIKMVERKACVDSDRCIDCQRCIDRCDKENAISRVSRSAEVMRYVDHTDVDQRQLKMFCAKAGILPHMAICGCTRTTGQEAVAAIMKGAKTPEDLCAMTGLRAGCGMYCMTRICQVFEACGITLENPKDRRWIKLTLSIADIPEEKIAEIDRVYPACHVRDDWRNMTQRRIVPAK